MKSTKPPMRALHFIRGNPEDIGKSIHVISVDPAAKNFAIFIQQRKPVNKTLVLEKFPPFSTFTELTENLERYREIYERCDLLIIERQLPRNYTAVRIAQHVISYFLIKFKCAIVEVDSKLKNRLIRNQAGKDAAQGLNKKKSIKQQSIHYAKSICDPETRAMIEKYKKQDDLCDAVCQCEAVFRSM
jgi:hypothetical protein